MQEKIFDFLMSFGLSEKAVILFLSALPVTELRASIPICIVVLKPEVLFLMRLYICCFC